MTTAIKLTFINLFLFLIVGLSLEVGARLAYPEFQGHVHSPTQTMGILTYNGTLKGLPVRVPYSDYNYPKDEPILVVLGDSVSNGYGSAFEDIYWVKFQRLLSIVQSPKANVVSLAGYGNNLSDAVVAIKALSSNGELKLRGILYQFNKNDVTPYGRENLKQIGNETIIHGEVFKRFAVWRYEYLNRSVLIRVASHYAGIFARRITGTCEERGMDALGPYTWTFGSRKYRAESEQYWKEFEEKLSELKKQAIQIRVPLWIFVSPLVFDVDKQGVHPYFNSTKLDFSCATIDPLERLGMIATRLEVPIIDPAAYLRESFERRLRENNFAPYFFTADENHFTPVAATYIAEYLVGQILPLDAFRYR